MNFLHDIAVPFNAFDGTVTFWLVPFTNLEAKIYQDELARLHPMMVWRHKETGEETAQNPYPGDSADPVVKAQREAGEWEAVDLWHWAEDCFVSILPLMVDIEFAGEKQLHADVRALRVYWEQRNGSVKHNWELYRQLVSASVINALYDAYRATRDASMDGPEEMQHEPTEDADPNS